MAKFHISNIAELSRQLAFAPSDTRSAQVAAAEELLHLIKPGQAYPVGFVIFKITGYNPKQSARDLGKDVLTGLALQHDLGLLVEQASDTLNLVAASMPEPVLGIDDVCQRFDVTSKTIQRWRRKGLPARRFIFRDGKRRVGFLLSSVERFFSIHHEQVARSANFSQVLPDELDKILRRAAMLAAGGCCAAEICRRIGRTLNRSPQTILHTIRKHDAEQPEQAILPRAPRPIADEARAAILKDHRHGRRLAAIAAERGCQRSAVARVLLEERIAHLNRKKIRFIDDSLYHGPNAEQAIEAISGGGELSVDRHASASGQVALIGAGRADSRIPRDLPPYVRDLYRTPLLTPAQERALFLKFNFRKYQFVSTRRRLDPQFARGRDLHRLETLLHRVVETKNQIVAANLRLVVSIARKHVRPAGCGTATEPSLMEFISEGNMTLMRAVEGFDVHKGHRFSTYATLALMKGFARSVPIMRAGGRKRPRGTRLVGDQRVLLDAADARHDAAAEHLLARDHVRHLLLRLDERERRVLAAHYGLPDGISDVTAERTSLFAAEDARHARISPDGEAADECGPALIGELAAAGPRRSRSSELNYEQVGRLLGLSKQRVRQIEQSALAKLRIYADSPIAG